MHLPPSVAEDVLAIWTGGERQVSLHTAAPGDSGGSEAAGVARADITSGTWGEPADADGSLCDEELTSGRQQESSAMVTFAGATAETTINHVGLWEGGTWLGGEALEEPVELGIGDEAYIDTGGLLLMVFGTNQVT